MYYYDLKLYLCLFWCVCSICTIQYLNFSWGVYIYIYPVNRWLWHYRFIISAYVLIFMWILYLCLHWHVFHLIQSTCWLYLLLRIVFYISPVHGLFYHCVVVKYEFLLIRLCISYQFLLQYVCLPYTNYYFVWIHIGRSFSLYLLVYYLTVTRKIWL